MDDLFQTYAPHETVYLTVNSRLALFLSKQYAAAQIQDTWITPTILPLHAWMTQQFHWHNRDGKILLSDFQEVSVWEKIIRASEAPFLQAAMTAKSVQQAWRFLNQWKVPFSALREFDNQESQFLLAWIESFQTICAENQWITQTEIPAFLIDQSLTLPKQVYFVGFDDFPPVIQTFIQHCSSKTTVLFDSEQSTKSTAGMMLFNDNDAELTAMAQWAYDLWLKNPAQQIACIVPDLQTQQAKVRRIFTDVFCMENSVPNAVHQPTPFNLSAGFPLSSHDMIKTALLILKWSHHALSAEEMTYLLQSPYFCFDQKERALAAQIDVRLREKNNAFVRPAQLFEILSTVQTTDEVPRAQATGHSRAPRSQTLSGRLRSRYLNLNVPTQAQTPKEWMNVFIALLESVQWPGKHTQESVLFQYVERFKKALQTFCEINLVHGQLSFDEAFANLKSLLNQIIFQPKSHQEPIQIMGILESSGMQFDAAWVMGLHNGNWPAPIHPHPFIPLKLQQQYQMPHASAQRELQLAELITQRLKHCAKTVIFSAPKQLGDQILQPSALLAKIEPHELTLTTRASLLETVWKSQLIETCLDETAPAVTEPLSIRGGSSIIKHQATCPFKAFATIRLNANALNDYMSGLDGATKGSLIHQVLYMIWDKVQTHRQMMALNDTELTTLIQDCTDNAISELKLKNTGNDYYWELEKKRVFKIVSQWLSLEKERPHFTVAHRELAVKITLNGLPIQLRIDRIDQLNDGSYLLIDYKTSETTLAPWFQERLSDPQLPLYAAFTSLDDNAISGMAFGQLKSGKLCYKGVVSESHVYTQQKVKGFSQIDQYKNELKVTEWNQLQGYWKNNLTQLAKDFCEGKAKVEPVSAQACQYCDLKSLCRVQMMASI